jgi:hypothetical protein
MPRFWVCGERFGVWLAGYFVGGAWEWWAEAHPTGGFGWVGDGCVGLGFFRGDSWGKFWWNFGVVFGGLVGYNLEIGMVQGDWTVRERVGHFSLAFGQTEGIRYEEVSSLIGLVVVFGGGAYGVSWWWFVVVDTGG